MVGKKYRPFYLSWFCHYLSSTVIAAARQGGQKFLCDNDYAHARALPPL
jgi:hypothetical protein